MKTHTIQILEHNALFSAELSDWEFNLWLYEHTDILNKKSLIGF